jgi:hypothetical protein
MRRYDTEVDHAPTGPTTPRRFPILSCSLRETRTKPPALHRRPGRSPIDLSSAIGQIRAKSPAGRSLLRPGSAGWATERSPGWSTPPGPPVHPNFRGRRPCFLSLYSMIPGFRYDLAQRPEKPGTTSSQWVRMRQPRPASGCPGLRCAPRAERPRKSIPGPLVYGSRSAIGKTRLAGEVLRAWEARCPALVTSSPFSMALSRIVQPGRYV